MGELTLAEIRNEPSPSRLLKQVYFKRTKKNPAYSVRAFARDLGMGATLVSLIFSNKRSVSYRQALKLATKLGMETDEKMEWLRLVLVSLPKRAKGKNRLNAMLRKASEDPLFIDSPLERVNRDVELFRALSQWYHVAIMDLSQVRGFQDDPKWIADRLGIHPFEAQDAIERMLGIGLMQRKDGKLTKTTRHMDFPTLHSAPAIREFHRQMCEKAMKELERTDPESFRKRKITSMTFSIRSDRLEEAYAKIEKFKLEMAELLAEGASDSLYHLGVNLFPLMRT
jgi:uncharacterized protein (TIGR02147 family)